MLTSYDAHAHQRANSADNRRYWLQLPVLLVVVSALFLSACAEEPSPPSGLLTDYANGVDAEFGVEAFSVGDPAIEITNPPITPYTGYSQQAGGTPLPNGAEFKVTNCELAPGKCAIECRLNGSFAFKSYKEKSPADNAIKDLGTAGLKTLTCFLLDETGAGVKQFANDSAQDVRNFYVRKPCKADNDCASNDGCAFEQCVSLECFYSPKPGCCNTKWDCGNGLQCTGAGTASAKCSSCTQDTDCNDGDSCTADKCDLSGLQGQCVNTKDKECCVKADDPCDDGLACTVDACDTTAGKCKHVKSAGACCSDTDCDPNDPCLAGQCVDAECRYGADIFKPDCCTPGGQNSSCDDKNFCSADKCDPTDASAQKITDGVKWTQCTHAPDPTKGSDCCDPFNQTNECDDNNACTADACVNFKCVNKIVAQCCLNDKDCTDTNKCTQEKCEKDEGAKVTDAGKCVYPKADPLCCESSTDCNDNKQCTSDSCNLFTSKCSFVKVDPTCCDADLECGDNDLCTTDFCVNGFCMHGPDGQKPNCCTKSENCNDNNPCTIDTCDANKNECQFVGNGDASCCVGNDDCDDGDCATLDFCASNNQCAFKADPTKCSTNIDCDDGLACTKDFCDNTGGCGICKHEAEAGCCDNDAQCNDGNACTTNKCTDNKCEKSGKPSCCLDDKDALTSCDDQNGCTIEYCVNNTCRHTVPKNGCCATNNDCEDGDFCTLNQCATVDPQTKIGSCQFPKDPNDLACVCDPQLVQQDLPGSHCNDNNTCTVDSCVGGKCLHAPKKGCCLDKFDCDDGNLCTFDKCVFNECINFESEGDQSLCCKKETENIDCAYLNTSCGKGICENQPDGSRTCVTETVDVCTVQIGYCQDFSASTDLKAMGWNPGDVAGTAKTNWKVATSGSLGPDQHAMLDWTPTKTDYETCLQSPVIQAAGSKSITIQYDRLLDIVAGKDDTTFRIYGSLDGANVDWTKATLIDVLTPKTDIGPSTVDLVLPPALTGSNGLRLAFCSAGTTTANLTKVGLDNICVVKGGKPTFGKCPPNQIAKFNDLVAIPLKSTDPDSDAILSFSLVNAPKFVTLSSALYFWLDNSWNTQLRILPKDPNDVGTHTITVKVSDGFLYSLCTFQVTVISESGYLVWRPTEVPSQHGEALETALKTWVKAQGLTGTKAVVQHTTDLSLFNDLSKFEAIYISLGIYPKKHVLTENEALPLKLFLQQSGKLYVEGGDTWAFDAQTSLHGFFHIQSAIDESPFGIDGTLKGTGVYQDAKQKPIRYYSWAYRHNDFTYENGNDLLSGNLKVKETRNVLENKGGQQQFHVQVAHDDPSSYRTVASSILFSGLTTGQGTDVPQAAVDRVQAFFAEGFIDCVSDDQCDDANKCTADKCTLDKRCEHTQICECKGDKAVACGETITIANTDAGKTSDVDTYNCATGEVFDGDEYAVSFTVDTSRPVELNVTELSNPKAKIFILNGGPTKLVPKCDTNACFSVGGKGTIKFAAAKGNTYYIVIDAPSGEKAQAKFTISCKAGEICNDLQDNNANTLVDCKDLASCCGDAACAEICDGLDNDCDGHIDEDCDVDGDKFCDGNKTVEGTPAICPNGGGDCDDNDSTVNAGVKEVCLNGKDDNCNGAQDEEGAAGCKNYYQDVDEDKFGAGAPKCLCAPKLTFTATKGGDCNDTDPKINPLDNPEICGNGVDDDCTGTQNDLNAIGCSEFYTDSDQDGFGTLPKKCLCFAEGAATAAKPGDCNDGDTLINPDAKEICNNLDDDCDNKIDEGCDDDGDDYCDFDLDYKAVGADQKQCAQAAEGANLNIKCAEGAAKITQISFASYGTPIGKCGGLEQTVCHAGSSVQKVKDACLGKNSCIIAATDAVFGKPCEGQKQLQIEVVCTGTSGVAPDVCPKGPGDTDDTDPKVNPEGIEICDGKDNDSDFKVDEDCDDDGDDYCDKDMIVIGAPDVCPKGKGDCDDNVKTTNPGVNENCATIGVDDNCNGNDNDVDADNCAPRFYDNDKDNYGTTDFKCLCKPLGLYFATLTGDCNDYDKTINPGAAEICDSIDNNCNGKINEGCDDDQDGYCDDTQPWDPTGILVCTNGKGDCDDTNKDVNPGKAEICGNGIDDDCDGSQNDPNAIGCTTFFSDADGDGFGTTNSKCLCVAEGTFTATKKGDCDDTNKDVNPIATEACNNIDDNCDGQKDEKCDQDGDGWCDSKKDVTLSDACPKSRPVCDGVEYNNTCYTGFKDVKDLAGATTHCKGLGGNLASIDESFENESVRKAALAVCGANTSSLIGASDAVKEGDFQWADGTAFQYTNWATGEPNNGGAGPDEDAVTIHATSGKWNDAVIVAKNCFVCEVALAAYAARPGEDCNDLDKTVYPGAVEACDDVDSDCDGTIDNACDQDKDGYCDATKVVSNPAPKACPQGGGDCDDYNQDQNPGVSEICGNGIDDDCNGSQNDQNATNCKAFFFDADGDKFGLNVSLCLCEAAGNYKASVGGDCNDKNAVINPDGKEVCGNALDDDCSGTQNDEDAQGCSKFFLDQDGDKHGLDGLTKCLCFGENQYTATKGGDCNDTNADINLGGVEVCDNADNDCDSKVDEGCNGDGDGYCNGKMITIGLPSACPSGGGDCNDADAQVNPGHPEWCDGKDNNCDSGNDAAALAAQRKKWEDAVTLRKQLESELDQMDQKITSTQDFVSSKKIECDANPSPECSADLKKAEDDLAAAKAGRPAKASALSSAKTTESAEYTKYINMLSAGGQADEGCDDDGDDYCDANMQTNGTPNVCPKGGGDCKDDDKLIHPGQTENCATPVDDDCSGSTNDEDALGCSKFGTDLDGDAYYPANGKIACLCKAEPPLTGTKAGDCDDANKLVNPGITEICDDIDNDCDGKIDNGCDDDGDNYCDSNIPTIGKPKVCINGGGDCNDNSASVNPGVKEVCNDNIDQNCDGDLNGIDAVGCSKYYHDGDGDGWAVNVSHCLCAPQGNYKVSDANKLGDCDDTTQTISPSAAEKCGDGVDNNCNGTQNDLNALGCKSFYEDGDKDGYGGGSARCQCVAEGTFVTALGGDCNDNDATVSPGSDEICDNQDNNCGGGSDEGCDNDLDGFCDATMKITAAATCAKSKKPAGTALLVKNADVKNTTVSGNSGKGQSYSVKCLNGYVVVGLGGLENNGVVSRYHLKCAKLNPDGSFGTVVKSDDFGTANSVALADRTCSGNQIVVGAVSYIHAATGELVRMTPRCKSVVDVAKNLANATATSTANFGATSAGQGTGNTLCADGYAVTGIQGKYGPNPFNVGFVCSKISNEVSGQVPGDDCVDTDKAINPDAVEACDDKDQDCDGVADNTCDVDLDGYCDKNKTVVGTPQVCPKGKNDCDDANSNVHPGKTEICDDVDNDCNGTLDDGCDVDGDDYCTQAKSVIGKPKVCPNGAGDCDDNVKAVNPGAKEICDGIDNNCAAGADEICKDNDGDGYCIGNTGISGGCPKGGNDCDDTNDSINPGQSEDCLTEADDNCSGTPNDLNAINCTDWYLDADSDNWGTGKSECRCHQEGNLTVSQGGDCDDTDSAVNPAALEICDGKNNDCNFGLLKGVQYTGQVITSMELGSHGGGFHLFNKEYWYPQWTSSNNTTVRKYDINQASKGTLQVPIRYIRQLSGDPLENSFYVATEYEGFRKYTGTTGNAVLKWTRNVGSYPGGISSDGKKVYGQRWNDYRSVYIMNRATGALEATTQLVGDVYNQYNFGLVHAIDGKLFRAAYAERWVYRYDISNMTHDGLKFRVAPTIYTSAWNGKELCVSSTNNSLYCYELPKAADPVPGTNGTITGLQPWGDGGGYHRFHKQFWIPEWTAGNTKIHMYNDKYEEIGSFQQGNQYIRQLAGDPNEDSYYTVSYSSSSGISRVRKQQGKTATITWEKTPSTYLSGVSVSGKNVFVMRHNDRTVWALDKTNGNTVKTTSLSGDFTGTMYGGLSVVGDKLYRASTDRWVYRYTVDLTKSSLPHDGGKFQIDVTPYFNAWTGSQLCYGSTSGSIWCYGLPGDLSALYSGTRNISPQSHGGGYHPLHKEYWSPGWTPGNTHIYRYNDAGGYLGGFYTGGRYIRQVAGDPTEDNYYTAEQYEGWRKRKGKTSQLLWSTYVGTYPGSIATDGNFVYGQRYNDHQTVYKMARDTGKMAATLKLDKWYGNDSYGGMQIAEGKLYRSTYSRWVWRYDVATMQHDGIRWQVAPTQYATALNSSNEFCAASTDAPYYCYKLPSKDASFIGSPAGMDARSHGAGYHPFFKEYWFPQWSGDTIYRYSAKGKLLGNFQSGQGQMMQVVGERTNGSYYTANWGYGTVTKLSGKNGLSKKLWTASLGGTIGGVAVDGSYVYAMQYNSSTLYYLNKDTGSTVKTINLSGGFTGSMNGGLAVVQGKLLRGTTDRWVYRYDLTTGTFDGVAFQTGTAIHASYFDDKNYCVTNNSYPSVHYCYPMTDVNKPLSDEGCDDDGDGFCDKDMQITVAGTQTVCPKTQMACDGKVYGSTCIRSYSEAGKTWEQAQTQCETWGGNLASVHGLGSASVIGSEAAATCGAKPYWIGLSDKDFGGAFRWSDSTAFDFTAWDTNEPQSVNKTNYFSGGSLVTPSEQATLNDWYDGKVSVSPLSKTNNITTGGQTFIFNFTGLPKPKAGVTSITVRTKVWGDYGSSSEYANVYIEGSSVGNVGNESGGDCNTSPKTRDFTRNVTEIADGAIKVQMSNTGSVGAGCTDRKVQVEIIYDFDDAGGQKTAKWKLCYKASSDGFNSSTFHQNCDAKGASFVIYTNDKGRKVGGFINSGWHSNNNYSSDSEAFMFSLTDGQVFDQIYTQYAIYGSNDYGPTWGAGHDLYVNSGMKNGYTYFGHSYKCPVGGSGSSACRDYLFGNYSSWTLSDVEVYVQDGFTTAPATDGEDYVLAGTNNKWKDVPNNTTADCFVCSRPITGAQYGFGDDCEDGDPASNPNTPEICDDKDNNCNGAIDEGCDSDGDKYCDSSMAVVGTPSACPNGGNDCDDNDNNINPGASENCNTEYDDNCNGVLSENNAVGCIKQYYDGDGDGYGTANFQCLCETSSCNQNILKEEFDAAVTGWTYKRCDANKATPTNCGNVTNGQGWQHRAKSFNFRTPSGVLYYGDPKTDNFAFGASAGTARSPKIKIAADAQPELTFSLYAGFESAPSKDQIQVRLYVDGKYVENVWEKGKSQSRFMRCDGSGVCTPGSKIINATQEAKINSWYGNNDAEWELCYQMSVDGTSPSTFHSKCDNKGETMAVVEATNGYKFGGYSPVSMSTSSGYRSTSSGWLYSINRDTKHKWYRYSQYGQYMNSSYGPTWGGGHDMRLASSDMRYNGYTYLGHTYQCPSGYGYGSSGCQSWIAGQYNNWTSKEFEVYKRRSGSSSFQTDSWVDFKFDLSKYAGKEVEFEFYFDTVDGGNNDGIGVFVDSFRVANKACSKYTASKYGDCDDTKGYVYPSTEAEICDNKDNNCNGVIDEACDADGDGYCDKDKFVTSTAACPKTGSSGSKDCKIVVGDSPQYKGSPISQNTYSHGGGYYPKYNEYLYPSWGSQTIYTFDKDRKSTGSFQTGQYYAMDAVGDSDTKIDRYYTANYQYYRIYAWNGKTTSSPWSAYLGYYVSYVTTDDKYVYAMRSNDNRVYVLDKNNGSNVANYYLSGGSYQSYWGHGGLVRLDKVDGGNTVRKLYRAAGSSNYVERYTLPTSGTTASFDGLRWQTAASIYNATFDGTDLCVSPNSSSVYCYTLKESTCIRGDDCNDNSKAQNPGQIELCDDLDNNCDGAADEKCDEDNDNYCKSGAAVVGTPKTCTAGGGDCDDGDSKKNPGSEEICDGKDNNCNLEIDEFGAKGCTTFYYDGDNDGYGVNSSRCLCKADAVFKVKSIAQPDCDDKCAACYPGAKEICDDRDNDCDKSVDENCDKDGDGYCDKNLVTVGNPKACKLGGQDCNDNAKTINPGAIELCNNADENCNGIIDENASDACGYIPNSISKCVAGKCTLLGCATGYYNLNGLISDGCECNGVDQHEPNDKCSLATTLSSDLYDHNPATGAGGTSVNVTGRLVQAPDEDWFRVYAKDNTDGGNNACDRFGVRIRFLKNPSSKLRFDIYRGQCPPVSNGAIPGPGTNGGENKSNAVCCGDTDFQWFTRFKNYARNYYSSGNSEYGQCPCQLTNSFDSSRSGWNSGYNYNGYPGPYCKDHKGQAGECIPNGYAKTKCQDDSAWLYIRVHEAPNSGAGSCSNYQFEITNGIYSGNHRGKNW